MLELRQFQLEKTPEEIRGRRFRPTAPIGSRELPFSPKRLEGRSVEQAIKWLIDRIEAELGYGLGEVSELDVLGLRRLVPAQKLAPVQFEIRNNKLAVSSTRSNPEEEDVSNVATAKDELIGRGERIIKELERSNCDRRLLESFQYLQGQLQDEANIIRVGITNLSCEVMCNQFESELPDAVCAMLRAHTRNINMYASQFPEWNRFIENASTAHLSDADIARIKDVTAQVADDLLANPELSDPEVPRTIVRLRELLDRPGVASKRAAFAVLRTLENMISSVFGYAVDLVDKTVRETVEQISKTAARIAVAGLLAIAIAGANGLQPVSGKIQEMQWIRSATDLLQRQLDMLKR